MRLPAATVYSIQGRHAFHETVDLRHVCQLIMATEAPDPKAFQSWEDAFQYPIPAVRGMERQLRNNIESNREKLRSLVG